MELVVDWTSIIGLGLKFTIITFNPLIVYIRAIPLNFNLNVNFMTKQIRITIHLQNCTQWNYLLGFQINACFSKKISVISTISL